MAQAEPTVSIALLICHHRGRSDLARLLPSLQPLRPEVVVLLVDDASPDDAAEWLAETYPEVQHLRLAENRGFAGANEAGWAWLQARYPELETLVLLNQDTVVAPGWLEAICQPLADPQVAAVQAKLLLMDAPEILNTAGNRCHYLGFGFMTGYGEVDRGQYDDIRTLGFASGAAVALRCSVLRELGLFDARFFMYMEDVDLGWKLRLAGYRSVLAPKARVLHNYRSAAPQRHYFGLERNRWVLLLSTLRVSTLVLLMPALLAMEMGQWGYAVSRGLAGDRWRVYRALMSREGWAWIRQRRQQLQRVRRVPDHVWMADFEGAIDTQVLASPVLRWVGNPILKAYWWLARKMLWG